VSEPTWIRDGDGGDDQTIEENWLFRLRRERYRSRHSGTTHDFYVLHLADVVQVVALTRDRHVILVEQFRAGSGRDSLETPGGLLEPGEDPLEAGARELLEETGYAGDAPQVLGACWSNPALLRSRVTTILIADAKPVAEPRLDPGEELRIELVAARAVPQLIRGGRIDHALVIQGLLLWLVAEIPDQPLTLPTAWSPRRRQYRIASIMGLVAVVAVMLGLIQNLGPPGVILSLGLVALPAAVLLVRRVLDPTGSSILLRSGRFSWQRGVLRLMAMIGVATVLVWTSLAILGLWPQ
jgi:8-oxo-dGTP pyrophosphatase MutT (NUDIX family)